MRIRLLLAALLALAPGLALAGKLEGGATIAFFGVHFIDTSTEGAVNGPRADETARVELLERFIADRLVQEGMTLLPLDPVQAELDRVVNPADCNGCALLMGRKLGARYVVVSEVQKVSNLILSMNLVVLDPETGAKVAGQSVDVRSNTDATWMRGMRYIFNNNLFRP